MNVRHTLQVEGGLQRFKKTFNCQLRISQHQTTETNFPNEFKKKIISGSHPKQLFNCDEKVWFGKNAQPDLK